MPKQYIKEYDRSLVNIQVRITTEHSFRGSLQTLLNNLLPQYKADLRYNYKVFTIKIGFAIF